MSEFTVNKEDLTVVLLNLLNELGKKYNARLAARRLISAFVIRIFEGIISKLATSEISIFYVFL